MPWLNPRFTTGTHKHTHTRHVKPEEMPNAKVCHVSVPNRTRCSPFNACWLLHKHCTLTFIWAFYIKVVELNMKSGTRLCCLSWQSALRQTHAYAQIWIQRRSINELQLQLGGTTIYKKWNRLSSPHTCTQRSCRTQVTRPTLQVMWTHMEHKVKSQKSYF